MSFRWLIPLLALGACQQDETLSAYVGDASVFQLQTLNGDLFEASADIDLSEAGKVHGQAPCNQYSAENTVPYPWIAVGPIVSTRRACADLAQENAFFKALASMAFAEVSGPNLVLSNADGDEMVFHTAP